MDNNPQSLNWFFNSLNREIQNNILNTGNTSNPGLSVPENLVKNDKTLKRTSSIFINQHNYTYSEFKTPNLIEIREILKKKEIELNRVCIFIKNFKKHN